MESYAWATVISQAFSEVALTIYVLVKLPELRPTRHNMPLDKALFHRIFSNAVLTSIQLFILYLDFIFIKRLSNSFGSSSDMVAFESVVIINMYIYMTIFCVVISILVAVSAKNIMVSRFQSFDVEIMKIGIQFLGIQGIFYICSGILFLLSGLYRGMSKVGIAVVLTINSFISHFVLKYVLSIIPTVGMHKNWWYILGGGVLADIVGVIVLWKKRIRVNDLGD